MLGLNWNSVVESSCGFVLSWCLLWCVDCCIFFLFNCCIFVWLRLCYAVFFSCCGVGCVVLCFSVALSYWNLVVCENAQIEHIGSVTDYSFQVSCSPGLALEACFLGGLHPPTLEPDASVGCRSDCFFNCLSLVPFPDAFFQLPLWWPRSNASLSDCNAGFGTLEERH